MLLQNVGSVGFEIAVVLLTCMSEAQVARRSSDFFVCILRGQLLILLCECTYVYLHNVPPADVSISLSLTLF